MVLCMPVGQIAADQPFEKIYVAPQDLLWMPSGGFYCAPNGEQIPITCLCCDACGTYIILIR